MKRIESCVFFALLAVGGLSLVSGYQSVYAGVPNEITYTGRLREYNQPVTGARTMNFRIYDGATGGTNLWSEDGVTVNVQSGVFTHSLGPVNIDWRGRDYWLETTISGKILAPREKLTAQVYALHSGTAEDIEKSAGQDIHFAIGAGTRAVITSGGYVGIGTVNPGYALECNGNIRISNGSGGKLIFADGSEMTTSGSGSASSVASTGDVSITANSDNSGSDKISFSIYNSEKMSIASNGEVTVKGDLTVEGASNLVPVGTVLSYAAPAAPSGWLLCNGSAVSRATYSRLFSIVGTQFGSGDGLTTFNVPDLRGRFLRGWDNGSGKDPDAGTRSAMASGGSSGNNIGSVQDDTFANHTHAISGDTIDGGGGNMRWGSAGAPTGSAPGSYVGGNETRPKNAYINYILKY